ncbi:MAG TPA: phosphoglycerate mutase family protein [Acidimicrobiia bacterium]|nr:phosphoglycerate mutase family protein [Acidimicrobiia bacterium]
MSVYLVRHAKAGSRRNWSGKDSQRPLSKPGQRQADQIASVLAGAAITRIVSSPFVRCVQTVEPLASACGIPVDLSDALAEGAPVADAAALLDKLAREESALCSHGDVIGDLLMHLADHGVRIGDFRLEKGSVWLLDTDDGHVVRARYLPPPS